MCKVLFACVVGRQRQVMPFHSAELVLLASHCCTSLASAPAQSCCFIGPCQFQRWNCSRPIQTMSLRSHSDTAAALAVLAVAAVGDAVLSARLNTCWQPLQCLRWEAAYAPLIIYIPELDVIIQSCKGPSPQVESLLATSAKLPAPSRTLAMAAGASAADHERASSVNGNEANE